MTILNILISIFSFREVFSLPQSSLRTQQHPIQTVAQTEGKCHRSPGEEHFGSSTAKKPFYLKKTGWTIPSVSNSRYLLHWQFPAEEIISFRGRNFCIRKSPQSLGSSITCGTEESVLTFRMVLSFSSCYAAYT